MQLFRLIIGWALIIAGVISIFLPFAQGILLILAGLAVLQSRRLLALFRKRKP